jgi:predicted GH43/DUF377 family glycosyl hydrolase
VSVVGPDDLATRQSLRLQPDPRRVIVKLFLPGHPDPRSGRQASGVVGHVLDLDDDAVSAGLAELLERFGDRHRALDETFRHHADRMASRLPEGTELSDERRMLLGAAFTHEYSVEAAALCNPSVVVAPDQTGATPGSVDLVMSVRGIGEGHRSSIGFRAVSVADDGTVHVDPPSPFTTQGSVGGTMLRADAFRGLARRMDDDADAIDWVLDRLGEEFTPEALEARLAELEDQGDTRPAVPKTVRRLRAVAARAYRTDFSPETALGERVLYPAIAVESNGVEDARFVRFDDDGEITYLATYTAYDGRNILQQLLETADFLTFDSSPLQGAAARNKGLALFPRRIDGHFHALSRHDGANNALAVTDDLRHWPKSTPIPTTPTLWGSVQVGNCGPPIETDAGWLVLTHGVGPMRTYSIGALLLDLEDPTRVLGELERPLLTPQPDEQDGYVPSVVYSCGSVVHAGNLVLPFGIGDSSIGFATAPLDRVLSAMVPPPG